MYSYDYVDNFSRFNEKKLPEKDEFYNRLTQSDISDDDYEYAQKVWKEFNIQTMGEYHDLYLKTVVLLLTDIFENFRKTCLQYYKLDPAHFYTIPGLAKNEQCRTGTDDRSRYVSLFRKFHSRWSLHDKQQVC